MDKKEKTALVAAVCALAGMVVGMVAYTRKKIGTIGSWEKDADDGSDDE